MEIKITINDKLINFLKKVFTKKNGVFIIAAVLFCGGLLIFSQQVELETFHDGDVIYAGPINDNFQALKDRELGSLGDVDTSGAGDGNVLQFNGTDWVPSTFTPNGVWATSGSDIYFNGGNVGIGTTSPDSPLVVVGTGGMEDNAYLRLKTDGTHGSQPIISFSVGISGNDIIDKSVIQGSYGTAGMGGRLHFWTKDTSETLQRRVTINEDGNVGIGTTDPSDKLSIGERVLISDSTNPANPPTGGVVIYFDGTQLMAKNSSGATSQITSF